MQNSNPCLTEPTKQTEASPATTPIPKAAPVGVRLDSALARQTRARKAVEAADKMLTIAKQRMKETMEELEQANSAVEIAKKKVGPATGLASDVTMLLGLLKPRKNSLSMNAADIIARIEKVVRIRETRFKECASCEMPPGIQLMQLDMPRMEAQEMASQIQAVEARQVEEEEEKAKRARIDAGKCPKRCSLTESLNNAANSIKDQKPDTPMKTASSSSSSAPAAKETPKAVSEFTALEFDSTLGYPGEGPPRVPDFGAMERCGSRDLAPWRVSRGGNAGKCERCKQVEKMRDVPQT